MSDLPNISQNNEQILNDIQSLQQMEQQLFNNLETTPNLTPEQQQKIVEKMNQLSNMRINLYTTLNGVNNFYESALSSSVETLKEQTIAIGIVENELNQSKKRLEFLQAEKNNKIRLVEINEYYGDKYSEHSQLMKILIFTLVPIIILAILHNKGILPTVIYQGLIIIISVIGIYFFGKRYASIITRDNMNYQEYDWYFQNTGDSSSTIADSSFDPWESLDIGTCIGEYCCSSGQTWDSSLNQCIGSSTVDISGNNTTNSTTNIGNVQYSQSESFINNLKFK